MCEHREMKGTFGPMRETAFKGGVHRHMMSCIMPTLSQIFGGGGIKGNERQWACSMQGQDAYTVLIGKPVKKPLRRLDLDVDEDKFKKVKLSL
jgi:hypothetical protein